MGWREWPSWLKGGVIGIIPGIFYFLWIFFLNIDNPDGNIFTHPYGGIAFQINGIILLGGICAGTVMGWIIGRIKNK